MSHKLGFDVKVSSTEIVARTARQSRLWKLPIAVVILAAVFGWFIA